MNKLLKAIEKFEKKKILVIGDIMLDQYLYGNTNRKNPEVSHASLVDVERKEYFLGGAANVANNLSSLDAKVTLVGVIGDDKEGKEIKHLANKRKIFLESFIDYDRPTTLKTRVIANNHQIARVDEEKTDEINYDLEQRIYGCVNNHIDNIDCIAFSDYDKGTLTKNLCQKVIDLAKKNYVLVLTDPKPKNIKYFINSNLIRPNHHEASLIVGLDYDNGNNLSRIAEKIKKISKCEYVVISCGKDGLFVYNKNKNKMIKTNAKELVDVTGAGDTVLVGLSLGLVSGLDIYESSELANYMAGIVVGKVGTATVTKEELVHSLTKNKK